jgi:hypothetical protein
MDESFSYDSDWQEEGSPWDEHKWELFMRERDERTDKYLERFAKLKDLPNCEELIARELNWDYDEDDEGSECPYEDMTCEECSERDACEAYLEDAGHEGRDEPDYEMPADFRSDPVWKEAYDLAIRLQYQTSSKMDVSGERGPLFDLLLNSRMVPAKIAGAFSLGFHVDAIGGNIANHKRALWSTLSCLGALSAVQSSGLLPRKICSRFRNALMDIREHLMQRIDELRELFHKLRGGS